MILQLNLTDIYFQFRSSAGSFITHTILIRKPKKNRLRLCWQTFNVGSNKKTPSYVFYIIIWNYVRWAHREKQTEFDKLCSTFERVVFGIHRLYFEWIIFPNLFFTFSLRYWLPKQTLNHCCWRDGSFVCVGVCVRPITQFVEHLWKGSIDWRPQPINFRSVVLFSPALFAGWLADSAWIFPKQLVSMHRQPHWHEIHY